MATKKRKSGVGRAPYNPLANIRDIATDTDIEKLLEQPWRVIQTLKVLGLNHDRHFYLLSFIGACDYKFRKNLQLDLYDTEFMKVMADTMMDFEAHVSQELDEAKKRGEGIGVGSLALDEEKVIAYFDVVKVLMSKLTIGEIHWCIKQGAFRQHKIAYGVGSAKKRTMQGALA